MKIPKFIRFPRFRGPRTIASRLTWRIVITLLIIFLILSILFFFILLFVGFVTLSALFYTRMSVTEEKVNNIFTAVEIATSNNIPEAEESIESNSKEYFAIERLLELNPNIVGAAIALNPDVEPRKGHLFAPYAYHDSTGIHSKRLDTDEYDYVHKEWFTKPLEQGKGTWSEPYVDEGGGEIWMTTYSLPLLNPKGDLYAVLTADLSLDKLTELVEELDSINNDDLDMSLGEDNRGESRTFIVTAKGTFVVHPERKQTDKENVLDYFKRITKRDNLATDLADDFKMGKKGLSVLVDKDTKYYFTFYVPIDRTGWTAATIVPFSDILPPVYFFIKLVIIILVISLIIIVLVAKKNIHSVTKPLRLFAQSATEISNGHLDTPLPVIKTKDEMLILHDSFETMQHSLASQIEQIKKVNEEKGRIEGELLIARNIQMAMIPKTFPAFPDRTDIDIFAELAPAKEVGGDLYDFLIRNEKLYFCVGDVSGKGVPASMVMAVTRALFRTATAHESNPGRMVSEINEMMVEDNDSYMFVTLFLGVLDLPTGRLRYCNAGHNAPLLIDDTEAKMLPCDANLPIGIMENRRFSTQEIVVSPGTTIFLYTDGVTEAENIKNEQFQENRMMDVAMYWDRQPKTLIEQMKKSVQEFVGEAEQNDDMTMLAIQYTKQPEQEEWLSRQITLPNDVEQVPLLSEFVEGVCEEVGLSMSDIMSMNLAIEEAVVNVMSYAYPKGTEGKVCIDAKANNEWLKFIITDWGKPFDPTIKDDIDITLPAEERLIGGLGIHIVRQTMDSINYERIEGKNVLTLIKKTK
ncbi:MAG: SpoIIE family protein phosphatase [Bacteroidaceae bacterium]|nr:SpoIIE family protein phosphatase [Bacteroidaceae bacterium]